MKHKKKQTIARRLLSNMEKLWPKVGLFQSRGWDLKKAAIEERVKRKESKQKKVKK